MCGLFLFSCSGDFQFTVNKRAASGSKYSIFVIKSCLKECCQNPGCPGKNKNIGLHRCRWLDLGRPIPRKSGNAFSRAAPRMPSRQRNIRCRHQGKDVHHDVEAGSCNIVDCPHHSPQAGPNRLRLSSPHRRPCTTRAWT